MTPRCTQMTLQRCLNVAQDDVSGRCCEHQHATSCLDGCVLAGTGPALRCREHGCRHCGGVMLADTEDWRWPLCEDCYVTLGEPAQEPDWTAAVMMIVDLRGEWSP